MATTVDISVGHSHLARGAKGYRKGGAVIQEYDFNAKVRAAMEELLRKNPPTSPPWVARWWEHKEHLQWGYRDGKLVQGKILTDRVRGMFADKLLEPRSKVALELHCNASKNTKYGGVMTIYRMEKDTPEHGTFEDAKGKALAGFVQVAVAKAFPCMKDRKVQPDQGDWVGRDLGFTRWGYRYGSVPVIVEFGFITCPNDQEVLVDEATPGKYASALIEAISGYLKSAT